MDKMTLLNEFMLRGAGELDLLPTIMNFFMCLLMGFVLRDFYIRRSFSLTGKQHIGSILPILSAVVFLVIVVVKSSLALSLGLVGALSIVRFRTPVKEPEDLVYLFLAIALGLGYGAGHALTVTVLAVIILLVIYFWLSNKNISMTSEYNMVIDWSDNNVSFDHLTQVIQKAVQSLKLVRMDRGKSGNTAVMVIVPNEDITFDSVVNKLQEIDSSVKLSFFEAKTNW